MLHEVYSEMLRTKWQKNINTQEIPALELHAIGLMF